MHTSMQQLIEKKKTKLPADSASISFPELSSLSYPILNQQTKKKPVKK